MKQFLTLHLGVGLFVFNINAQHKYYFASKNASGEKGTVDFFDHRLSVNQHFAPGPCEMK